MKRLHRNSAASHGSRRRGTVLVVVMGLLGLLMLIGFTFFTFARQEEGNAEYFNAAAKTPQVGLSADLFFDWGLSQLIKGAPTQLKNSALYGGRHSLVPNMFGRDMHPYNGQGVTLKPDTTSGLPFVDQNFDGMAEGAPGPGTPHLQGRNLLDIADSPSAHGIYEQNYFNQAPMPDVDYTSPDINSVFLAYNGYALNGAGQSVRVITPSFHRPQYLRELVGGNVRVIRDWWQNTATTDNVMRAHAQHQHVFTFPNTDPNDVSNTRVLGNRYITSQPTASDPVPFPIDPKDPTGVNQDPNSDRQGVWSIDGTTGLQAYEWDADADGDGIREAVWLDLDFPVQTVPDGSGRKFTAMFGFTVYDADGLLNLLAHGNVDGYFPQLYESLNGSGNPQFGHLGSGSPPSLHRSNLGVSTFEINPQYALNANGVDIATPGGDRNLALNPTPFEQHQFFYKHSPSASGVNDWAELSNMEWFHCRVGKPEYDSSGTSFNDYHVGTNGEDLIAGNQGTLVAALTNNGSAFPQAGTRNVDDNQNRHGGERTPGVSGFGARFLESYRHPLDFRGIGISYDTGGPGPDDMGVGSIRDGKTRLFADYTDVGGSAIRFPNKFPYYQNYNTSGTVRWGLLGLMNPPAPFQHLIDESFEMELDLAKAKASDAVLPVSDNAFLAMSDLDIANRGINSRVGKLMEYNLSPTGGNARAEQIRKRFTTSSWDVKTHGKPHFFRGPSGNNQRRWEFTEILNNGNPQSPRVFEFPPFRDNDSADANDGGTYDPDNPNPQEPFRLALRRAIRVRSGEQIARQFRQQFQRLLGINSRISLISNNDPNIGTAGPNALVKYPLAPHPADPGAASITAIRRTGGNPHPDRNRPAQLCVEPYNAGSAALQEAWARWDRQQMARDIYVMLYVLGGGNDAVDYFNTSNAGNTLYSDDEMRQMAQFAANVVNQLDRDNVMDPFEYDKNLADGWNLDDNPYDNGDHGSGADGDVVYGREAQQLTLSEGLVLKSVKATPTAHDVDATEFPDDTDHYFSFVELYNASTDDVSFKGNWKLEVIVDNNVATKRTVVLNGNPGGPIRSQETLTLLSGVDEAGGRVKDDMGADSDSYFRADLDFDPMSGGATPNFTTIIPGRTPSGTFPAARMIDLPVQNAALAEVQGFGNVGREAMIDALNAGTLDPNTPIRVELRLYRRLHLGRTEPTNDTDNPWWPVDQMVLGTNPVSGSTERGWGVSAIQWTTSDEHGHHVRTALVKNEHQVFSKERLQPLQTVQLDVNNPAYGRHRAVNAGTPPISEVTPRMRQAILDTDGNGSLSRAEVEDFAPPMGTPTPIAATRFRMNSFGEINHRSLLRGRSFDFDETQFDRDFYSVSEWLSIPVTGHADMTGNELTSYESAFPPPPPLNTRTIYRTPTLSGTETAGVAKFLNTVSAPNGNRWYRILAFFEFPSLVNQAADIRMPGLLNLNTLRHPAALAGLVDDQYAFNTFRPLKEDGTFAVGGSGQTSYIPDRFEGTNRDWWAQFILSRDRLDPVSNLYLPGTIHSRPFRDLSHTAVGANTIDHTVLRSLWTDESQPNNPLQKRRLFELQTQGERDLATDANQLNDIDSISKHRLLSKLINNTTTRSNVFFVFIKVDFFEVTESTSMGQTLQQIGGKLPESPGFRGFFVVDRSLAFDELSQNDFVNNNEGARFFIRDSFDWRKLVRHRQRIE